MDFNTYRHAYFTDPTPEPRFDLEGVVGITLFFADYAEAVDFYTQVLGTPAYSEGAATRGWRLGETWLTLLAGGEGSPASTRRFRLGKSQLAADRLRPARRDPLRPGARHERRRSPRGRR